MISSNTNSSSQIQLDALIPQEYHGMRFDQALAKCFPEHSRSRLTQWIKEGVALLNGKPAEPKFKVQGGETVSVQTFLQPIHEDVAEEIPLNIVFEDSDILIVNKAAGLVVHPAAGNHQHTLLNALLFHAPELNLLPRAGIIHRLDKDTTGLMVIAKTLNAHTSLVAALARRDIAREYLALVGHEIIAGKTIDARIGRHPHQRIKMAVVQNGKMARTHYRCEKRYQGFTLLHVKLETGRTHQIRVHLSHEGYPIVGDVLYGWRCRYPAKSSEQLQQKLKAFDRQALHAWKLALNHPISGERLCFQAPVPPDFNDLLTVLELKVN